MSWLIVVGELAPFYLAQRGDRGRLATWTFNREEATRFPSRLAAESYIAARLDGDVRVEPLA